MRQRQWC